MEITKYSSRKKNQKGARRKSRKNKHLSEEIYEKADSGEKKK